MQLALPSAGAPEPEPAHAPTLPKLLVPETSAVPRALVRGEGGGARVVAVCARARHAGVRIGITSAEARARVPSLSIATLDPARVEAIEAAVVDALVTVSPRLGRTGELGGLHDDERARSHAFGLRPASAPHDDFLLDLASPADLERLAEVVRDLDLGPVTIGVADGAFAAVCAAHAIEPHAGDPHAASAPRRKVVARGGDAGFLAPLPSSLLPASPGALDALQSLGLHTLALVAALPLEGVQARLGEEGRYLVGLARGHAPPALATYVPGSEPSVEVDLVDADPASSGATTLEPIVFALRAACSRLVPPLAARGSGIGEAELVLEGERAHASTRVVLRPARAEIDPQALFELARATLEGAFRTPLPDADAAEGSRGLTPVARVRLTATSLVPIEHVGERLPFARRDATILPLDVALARLRGRFGRERVVTPVRHEDPRPDGRGVFRPALARAASSPTEGAQVHERAPTAPPAPSLRERLRAPSPAVGAVILSRAPIAGDPWPVRTLGGVDPRKRRVVREVSPPERVVGGWWNEPFELVYRWAVADDGARALFVRAAEQGGFRLVGIAD